MSEDPETTKTSRTYIGRYHKRGLIERSLQTYHLLEPSISERGRSRLRPNKPEVTLFLLQGEFPFPVRPHEHQVSRSVPRESTPGTDPVSGGCIRRRWTRRVIVSVPQISVSPRYSWYFEPDGRPTVHCCCRQRRGP